MTKAPIHESAPAKINLYLHVTGIRENGYHDLDTLVGFATICDSISVRPARAGARPISLEITGPFAAATPPGADNLVVGAATLFHRQAAIAAGGPPPPALITLEKNIPPASGIGGGSADAAATLRALNKFWRLDLPLGDLIALASSLGADIPMCLHSNPLRARGIGEQIEPISGLPAIPAVLVNPGTSLETPAVFNALTKKNNAPAPDLPSTKRDQNTLINFLATCRNDLQAPAIERVPQINDVLDALVRQQGCLLARMSGSGATCFGLFKDLDIANRAAKTIANSRPGWWVRGCEVNSKN